MSGACQAARLPDCWLDFPFTKLMTRFPTEMTFPRTAMPLVQLVATAPVNVVTPFLVVVKMNESVKLLLAAPLRNPPIEGPYLRPSVTSLKTFSRVLVVKPKWKPYTAHIIHTLSFSTPNLAASLSTLLSRSLRSLSNSSSNFTSPNKRQRMSISKKALKNKDLESKAA